jgi:hypothetical protein
MCVYICVCDHTHSRFLHVYARVCAGMTESEYKGAFALESFAAGTRADTLVMTTPNRTRKIEIEWNSLEFHEDGVTQARKYNNTLRYFGLPLRELSISKHGFVSLTSSREACTLEEVKIALGMPLPFDPQEFAIVSNSTCIPDVIGVSVHEYGVADEGQERLEHPESGVWVTSVDETVVVLWKDMKQHNSSASSNKRGLLGWTGDAWHTFAMILGPDGSIVMRFLDVGAFPSGLVRSWDNADGLSTLDYGDATGKSVLNSGSALAGFDKTNSSMHFCALGAADQFCVYPRSGRVPSVVDPQYSKVTVATAATGCLRDPVFAGLIQCSFGGVTSTGKVTKSGNEISCPVPNHQVLDSAAATISVALTIEVGKTAIPFSPLKYTIVHPSSSLGLSGQKNPRCDECAHVVTDSDPTLCAKDCRGRPGGNHARNQCGDCVSRPRLNDKPNLDCEGQCHGPFIPFSSVDHNYCYCHNTPGADKQSVIGVYTKCDIFLKRDGPLEIVETIKSVHIYRYVAIYVMWVAMVCLCGQQLGLVRKFQSWHVHLNNGLGPSQLVFPSRIVHGARRQVVQEAPGSGASGDEADGGGGDDDGELPLRGRLARMMGAAPQVAGQSGVVGQQANLPGLVPARSEAAELELALAAVAAMEAREQKAAAAASAAGSSGHAGDSGGIELTRIAMSRSRDPKTVLAEGETRKQASRGGVFIIHNNPTSSYEKEKKEKKEEKKKEKKEEKEEKAAESTDVDEKKGVSTSRPRVYSMTMQRRSDSIGTLEPITDGDVLFAKNQQRAERRLSRKKSSKRGSSKKRKSGDVSLSTVDGHTHGRDRLSSDELTADAKRRWEDRQRTGSESPLATARTMEDWQHAQENAVEMKAARQERKESAGSAAVVEQLLLAPLVEVDDVPVSMDIVVSVMHTDQDEDAGVMEDIEDNSGVLEVSGAVVDMLDALSSQLPSSQEEEEFEY